MAAFDPSAGTDRDFLLVRDSFVTMFRTDAGLADTTTWLTRHGYQVVTIDTGGWTSGTDLHRDLAATLDFPEHYGRNLDALADGLRDVGDPTATGFVLVLRHYDRFAAVQPRIAHALLDVYARRAREAALIGRRMMCLVQTDDARSSFADVGATPVGWNDAEWPAVDPAAGA